MLRLINRTEQAVGEEVGRLVTERDRETSPCWCALCESDVTALSLTTLPPRYSTAHPEGWVVDHSMMTKVSSAITTAMSRVGRRPKHRFSSPETDPARVQLINYVYEESVSLVSTILHQGEEYCDCDRCFADTLAFTLNRYPPRYGVEVQGRSNLPHNQLAFMRHELSMLITHAARTIAQKPHH